jgi:hypothetical protein
MEGAFQRRFDVDDDLGVQPLPLRLAISATSLAQKFGL